MDMTSHEMRNPLSAIFQCADAIVTTLTEYQSSTHRPRPSTRSQSRRVGKSGDNSHPEPEDPVTYAIEAASIITLCAQRKQSRGVNITSGTDVWTLHAMVFYISLLNGSLYCALA
jgi:hypothetical protein